MCLQVSFVVKNDSLYERAACYVVIFLMFYVLPKILVSRSMVGSHLVTFTRDDGIVSFHCLRLLKPVK